MTDLSAIPRNERGIEVSIKPWVEAGFREFPVPSMGFGRFADAAFQKTIRVCGKRVFFIDAYFYDRSTRGGEGVGVSCDCIYNRDGVERAFDVHLHDGKNPEYAEEFFWNIFSLMGCQQYDDFN